MDSYVTIEYADDYHDKRVTATKWDMFDDKQKGGRLVSASDFINYNFTLKKEVIESIEKGEVPTRLKNAVCEISVLDSLVVARAKDRSRVKVDVIEVQYTEGVDAYSNDLNKIANMLNGLIEEDLGNAFQFEVSR